MTQNSASSANDKGACCIADYLTMDFPDYFVRRRRGFLTLFGLCRIDDEPVPTHFCLPREGRADRFVLLVGAWLEGQRE